MGAKTALLAFIDGDLRPALLGATRDVRSDVEDLVRQLHRGFLVEADGDTTLDGGVHPPDHVNNATVLVGTARLRCCRDPEVTGSHAR